MLLLLLLVHLIMSQTTWGFVPTPQHPQRPFVTTELAAAEVIDPVVQIAGSIAAGLGLGGGLLGIKDVACRPSKGNRWGRALFTGSLLSLGLQVSEPTPRSSKQDLAVHQTAAIGATLLSLGGLGVLTNKDLEMAKQVEEELAADVEALPVVEPRPTPKAIPSPTKAKGIQSYLDAMEESVTQVERYVGAVEEKLPGFTVTQNAVAAVPAWVQSIPRSSSRSTSTPNEPVPKKSRSPTGFAIAPDSIVTAVPKWVQESKRRPIAPSPRPLPPKPPQPATGFSVDIAPDSIVTAVPKWVQESKPRLVVPSPRPMPPKPPQQATGFSVAPNSIRPAVPSWVNPTEHAAAQQQQETNVSPSRQPLPPKTTPQPVGDFRAISNAVAAVPAWVQPPAATKQQRKTIESFNQLETYQQASKATGRNNSYTAAPSPPKTNKTLSTRSFSSFLNSINDSQVSAPAFVESLENAIANSPYSPLVPPAQSKTDRFAPTRASVKHKSAQTQSPYLHALKESVGTLSSFVGAVHDAHDMQPGVTDAFDAAVLEQSDAYVGTLEEATSTLSSFVDTMGEVVPEVVFEPVSGSTQAPAPPSQFSAAPFVTIARQVEKTDRYAPTKTSVKNVDSSTSGYLGELKQAVTSLSSFVDAVGTVPLPSIAIAAAKVEPFMTIPKKLEKTDNYAPSKSSIKHTSAQSTGYLSSLRDAVTTLSSFVDAVEDSVPVVETAVIPRIDLSPERTKTESTPFVTVPRTIEKTDRYAPSRATLKCADRQGADNLVDLQSAVASFIPDDRAGASTWTESDAMRKQAAPEPLPLPFVTVPRSIEKTDLYAPSRATIRAADGKSSDLSAIQIAGASSSSFVENGGESTAAHYSDQDAMATPAFSTVPRSVEKTDGYSPTKSSVKNVDGRSGGYLDSIKGAVASLDSFVGVVKTAEVASHGEGSTMTADPSKTPKTDNYFPGNTNASVATTTQSNGNSGNLKESVQSLSSFVDKTSAMFPDAEQTTMETLKLDIAAISSSVEEVRESLATALADLSELKGAIGEIRSLVNSVYEPRGGRLADNSSPSDAAWGTNSLTP